MSYEIDRESEYAYVRRAQPDPDDAVVAKIDRWRSCSIEEWTEILDRLDGIDRISVGDLVVTKDGDEGRVVRVESSLVAVVGGGSVVETFVKVRVTGTAGLVPTSIHVTPDEIVEVSR